MIKQLIRQWLCEHKHQRPLKLREEVEKTAGTIKAKQIDWVQQSVIWFKRWDQCEDCGKILIIKINITK